MNQVVVVLQSVAVDMKIMIWNLPRLAPIQHLPTRSDRRDGPAQQRRATRDTCQCGSRLGDELTNMWKHTKMASAMPAKCFAAACRGFAGAPQHRCIMLARNQRSTSAPVSTYHQTCLIPRSFWQRFSLFQQKIVGTQRTHPIKSRQISL